MNNVKILSLSYGNYVPLDDYVKLEQALNEIKKVINECKMLMPHEFDWEEQADYILKIIDKVGGNE